MHCNIQSITEYAVAPRVGAWIETLLGCYHRRRQKSHPEWVRGLKLEKSEIESRSSESHPEWVRGLKLHRELRIRLVTASHPEWVRGLKR